MKPALRPLGAPIWFTGNRRMAGFGIALVLLAGVLLIGILRSRELHFSDPVRVTAIVLLGLVLLAGIAFIVLPDKLKVVNDRLQVYVAGMIPGRAYRLGAFKGLWVSHPPTRLELEFGSGRRIPFFGHPDPFVVLELARELSRATKLFVRHDEVKLFKDGSPPNRPNFFLQHEKLDPAVLRSRYPLAEATRNEEGYRFKLFMARALPNGERGLIVYLNGKGLQIFAEGLPQLVDVPLLDVIDVEVAPGYLGILTRDRGVLKLEGVGSPQDRYLALHLAAAMRELIKEEKNESGKSEM